MLFNFAFFFLFKLSDSLNDFHPTWGTHVAFCATSVFVYLTRAAKEMTDCENFLSQGPDMFIFLHRNRREKKVSCSIILKVDSD